MKIKMRTWIDGQFFYWGHIKPDIFAGPVSSSGESLSIEEMMKQTWLLTGLRDKNGKEIYEGDIVKNGKGIIYEVKWYNFGFHLDTAKVDGKWTSYTLENYEHIHWSGPSISSGMKEPEHYKDWHIKIIGNIYENPELINAMQT